MRIHPEPVTFVSKWLSIVSTCVYLYYTSVVYQIINTQSVHVTKISRDFRSSALMSLKITCFLSFTSAKLLSNNLTNDTAAAWKSLPTCLIMNRSNRAATREWKNMRRWTQRNTYFVEQILDEWNEPGDEVEVVDVCLRNF